MNTYLGASEFLGPEDVDGDLIAAAQVTYLEGYLFDRPEAQEAYWKASRIAHDAGRRVSLTLSDTFCVERHKEAWRTLVADQVDILFANEGEAMALYDVDSLDAVLEHVKADVEIAAVTCGAEGLARRARRRGDRDRRPPGRRVVDTTGAGDLYAAGFLYGYTAGRPLEVCGRLGSMAATAVLGHTGPGPGCRSPSWPSSSGL